MGLFFLRLDLWIYFLGSDSLHGNKEKRELGKLQIKQQTFVILPNFKATGLSILSPKQGAQLS